MLVRLGRTFVLFRLVGRDFTVFLHILDYMQDVFYYVEGCVCSETFRHFRLWFCSVEIKTLLIIISKKSTMSKAGAKGMRNVKKVVEKINHTSKLRTYVQAQLAVGELNHQNSRKSNFHIENPAPSQPAHHSDRSSVSEASTLLHSARTSMRRRRSTRREFRCRVGLVILVKSGMF